MRQFRLAMSIMVVAIAAAGCGRKNEADQSATRVVRPDEVKISLGSQAETKSAPAAAEAPATAPPATEGKAP